MAKTKWPPSEWRPRVKNTTNFCNQKGCKCMYITYKYYKSYNKNDYKSLNKMISVNNLNFGPVSVVVQIKLKIHKTLWKLKKSCVFFAARSHM
jgi:hypothetical protein